MKKIVFLLTMVVMTVGAMAQFTTPRVGTGVKYDPRNLNYTYGTATDATGADSTTLAPNAWLHTVKITLLDSFTLKNPTVTKSYYGDQLQLILTAASGTPKLKFTGSNWITAGTATLSTGLRGVILLVFDGAKWVERSRVIQ
jgi:hypothetical protein